MAQYFIRQIDKYLNEWKDDRYRKPLLIRGARQIGKSSAARNFGKTFKYFVEINLEREQDLKELFGKNIDVKKICSRLSVLKQIPIVPGETLLFIDEIQESERAIASLRYFMNRHAPISIMMDLVTSPSPVFIFIYICSAPMMATEVKWLTIFKHYIV